MQPKPAHLGAEYAAQFTDASIVAAYPHRPPYPAETFDVLRALVVGGPATVLDVGCGTGDLARPLAARVARLDAVDISTGMLSLGMSLPGGDRANLTWIRSAVEEAPLRPPYGLVTAGESLHWMEWQVVLPRLGAALAPGAFLAIVGRAELSAWWPSLQRLITRHSTNRAYAPYDLVRELEDRRLFATIGERVTQPLDFAQPVASYIESIHSRNGFSRDRMPPEGAAAFDAAVARLLAPHTDAAGRVTFQLAARIIWGIPGGS